MTDTSDFDVFVIVRQPDDQWRYVYAAPVEMVTLTVADFDSYGLPGGRDGWNRPAFLFARVEIDRLDGTIGHIVERKRRLTPAEAQHIARESLDDYINALYRSLKNLEASRDLEGRLDAIESLSPLLTTAFALDGRVRPFNKWLRHDLGREPLTMDGLLPRVERIARDSGTDEQRAMFRDIERHARASGHDAGIDSWEPNVAWLRGEDGPDLPPLP